MPTGYTNTLDESKKTTKDWIIEDLSRNFGMCIMLRDDDFGMSAEQILEKLQKKSNYHDEALSKAKALFLEYEAMDDKAWRKLMAKENEVLSDGNQQSEIDASALKELHARAEKDLRIVLCKTDDEVTISVCRFGLQQLKTTESDCDSYISELYAHLEAFKKTKIEGEMRNIAYHQKNLKEDAERNKDRVDCFIKMRDEVTRILTEDQSR